MPESLDAAFARTKEPRPLLDAAKRAASSTDEAEHVTLRAYMLKPDFVNALDNAEDYRGLPRQLRLAGIIKDLMNNRCAASNTTLDTLANDAWFTSIELRQNLMIQAMVEVRPASLAGVALWKAHSVPKAPWKHLAAQCMCDNGTPPAMELFEAVLADATHAPEDRVAWMRGPLLVNRANPNVLISAEKMLKGAGANQSLPIKLRPDLVAAVFDHRENWYLSCDPPVPPSRTAYGKDAQEILRRIGEYSLASVPLDAQTKAAVELTMQWLGKPKA